MSSGFISENEIANQKQKRQEEWEKVRTADQPVEAPEEDYDPRSLYDRLKEQKDKKEFEYEEAHKLKNMIKGLDDDEVDFLDLIDRSKYEEEKKKYLEESKELNEFRQRRACLDEESLEQRIKAEIKTNNVVKTNGNKISSQSKLLAGAVVKKNQNNKNTAQSLSPEENKNSIKRKLDDTDIDDKNEEASIKQKFNSKEDSSSVAASSSSSLVGGLPGIGSYSDTSDSDSSSSDFEELDGSGLDLCGRKIVQKKD